MSNRNEFNLEPGDCLTVKERYVSVYSTTNRGYRFYCLNGEHITTFTEELFKHMLSSSCIFLDNNILVKKADAWGLIDYEGTKIGDFFARDLVVVDNTILMVWPDDSMAIYSSAGEILLATNPEHKFNGLIADRFVIIDFKSEYKRLYDLKEKKFCSEPFAESKALYSAIILYPDGLSGECYLFNALTGEIEEKYDACFWNLIPNDASFSHAIWVYKNGECGLWMESEAFLYQVAPTEYTRIDVDSNRIIARKNGCGISYEVDNFPQSKPSQPRKMGQVISTKRIMPNEITYNGVKIKKGEELRFFNNCFYVFKNTESDEEKKKYGTKFAKFYTLDGKYIADAGCKYDKNGEISSVNFLQSPKILLLGDNCTEPYDNQWRLYYYTGERVISKVFKSADANPLWRSILMFCTEKESRDNEIYFYSYETGKLLFNVSGFKKVRRITDKYVFVLDFDEKVQVFDKETGAKILDEPISTRYFTLGNLIFEHVTYGYKIYDCDNKKQYFVKADEMSTARASVIMNYAFLEVRRGSLVGIYDYSEERGPYEIVPIKYDMIEVCDICIRAQRFSEDETDDIYSFDGKLISSTSK